LASFGIGAKLRQERVGKGLAIDDIARDTKIAPRFLEAIETDDYSTLPGLVFARNFVRQYALTLQLDPDPLLAELPKQDESTVPLPNPPGRARSSYYTDRRLRSLLFSIMWLLLAFAAGLGGFAYMHSNHSLRAAAPQAGSIAPAGAPDLNSPSTKPAPATVGQTQTAVEQTKEAALTTTAPAPSAPPSASTSAAAAPVRVSVTASERAWVQVSVDGKTTFIGTLTPNETKDISGAEQVTVLTGNAGALSISLNGKTLESLGPRGHVREVRLTAEGPQFLSKDPPPAPDPL
jgi:cytoskeletal protein RodZ